MARLYQQIICKTKSFNDRLFRRISFRSSSIFPVTTLKSKLSTSKRAFTSLSLPPYIISSIQIPSVPFPSINIPNPIIFKKRQQKQHKRTKYRKGYKYGFAALATYLCTEILFNLRCRYLEHYANNISVDIPHISRERCEHLLDLALKYAQLYEGGFEGWLKLWFNECDINDLREENILELFHWGFFVENYVKHDQSINDPELEFREQFVRNSLTKLETQMDHKFAAGYNDKITDRFNTKASVNIDYHPFALYSLIKLSQIWSNLYFAHFCGLESEWIHDMKVWYKMPKNGHKSDEAVLFLHGVGIGLGPYYNVVQELMNKKDDNMFCMIEIPHITIDILHLLPSPFSNYSYITKKLPPNISDYIHVLDKMERKLATVNDINWTFVGHSYGTMIAANMYLQMENESKPRLVLLDPACFCLSHPSTVAAFVTDIDAIVDNDEFMPKWNARKILAKELMISCCLRKYFHWYDLVIYPEQMVDDKQHIVVTASKDNVVPVQLIARGIQNVNDDDENDITIIHQSVDKGHGEWLWDKQCIKNMLCAM